MTTDAVSVRLKKVRIDRDALLAPGSGVYIAAERAAQAAVRHVQGEMIRMDIIDSGALYNSIDSEIYRQGDSIVIAVGPMKGSDAVQKRAKYVEYGTRSPIPAAGPKNMPIKIKNGPFLIRDRVSGQSSQPFLRNALKKVATKDWNRA